MTIAATGAEPATRNPFTTPGFRRWWAASVIAGAGVGIQSVTVPLFIRDRVEPDQRAAAIAGALVASNLVAAALTLFGGVAADRLERSRVLVRTYTVAAAVSLIYVALSSADVQAVWPVYILASIVGAAGAFTNPARQSMVPALVPRAQLANAIILGNIGFMALVQFGGPAFGGILADFTGLTAAFAFEVAFLAIAALLFGGVANPLPGHPRERQTVLADLGAGLRYAAGEPALRGLLLIGAAPGILVMGPFMVTLVILVQDAFAAPDRYVGFFTGAFGAGILAGSVLLTLHPLRRRGLLVCICLVAGGPFFLFYGIAPNVWVAMAMLFLLGITGPAIFINAVFALLQENTRPEMLGRVTSMYGLTFTLALPAGFFLAGALATAIGERATVVAGAIAITVVGIVCTATMRSVRSLE